MKNDYNDVSPSLRGILKNLDASMPMKLAGTPEGDALLKNVMEAEIQAGNKLAEDIRKAAEVKVVNVDICDAIVNHPLLSMLKASFEKDNNEKFKENHKLKILCKVVGVEGDSQLIKFTARMRLSARIDKIFYEKTFRLPLNIGIFEEGDISKDRALMKAIESIAGLFLVDLGKAGLHTVASVLENPINEKKK